MTIGKKATPQKNVLGLAQRFKGVCATCKQLGTNLKPLKTNSGYAQAARLSLEAFAGAIKSELPSVDWATREIVVSRGQTVMPKVLWVAIVPVGAKVSSSPSVAICFGSAGEGAVVGLMRPASAAHSHLKTVKRTGKPGMRVNVDSSKSQSSYNDKFVNPVEFFPDEFDADAFVRHLKDSIEL